MGLGVKAKTNITKICIRFLSMNEGIIGTSISLLAWLSITISA